MKTKMKKISSGILSFVAILVFCSFINHTSGYGGGKGSDELYAVREFVSKTICEPLRIGLKNKYGAFDKENFSRCPSGYYPQLSKQDKDAKKDEFVFGTVKVYRGCSGRYVCNFKVCVDKGIALIKSTKDGEYVTVESWLKNEKETKVVKL